MNTASNIINVTDSDFEYEVIAYSQQVLVIVDFWAEWCAPCRVIGPILEKLARQAEGSFRLAKVDIDQNPSLTRRFNIRSIPVIKAFRDGQMVGELRGSQPEAQMRQFIERLLPDEFTLPLEKGFGLLANDALTAAERTFRDVLDQSPNRPEAMLGLSKVLLRQGKPGEARQLLERVPIGHQSNAAEALRPLAIALHAHKANPLDDAEGLDATYQRAMRLALMDNLPAAIDGLLDILREDRRYANGAAHKLILGLLELMGEEHPSTSDYRRELANVLF